MAVKIVTDSTSYIREELKKKYDISIASLSVIFENEEFKEIHIENESFYENFDASCFSRGWISNNQENFV